MATTFIEAFNEQTLALRELAAALRDQQLCCGPVSEMPYYPPGYDPTENPETSTFCDAAHSFVENWRIAAKEVMTKAIAGNELGVGVLALILATLAVPIAAIITIAGLIFLFVLEIAEADLLQGIDDMYSDMVCAIYTAVSPQHAKQQLDQVIDDYAQSVAWGAIGTNILKNMISSAALNEVFAETYTIRPDKIGSSCQCGPAELCFLRTSPVDPYDTILVGGIDYQWDQHSGSGGWRTGAPNWIGISFTAIESLTQARVSFIIWSVNPPGPTQVQIRKYPEGTLLAQTPTFEPASNPGTEHQYDLTVAMTQGESYAFVVVGQENEYYWCRDIRVCKIQE